MPAWNGYATLSGAPVSADTMLLLDTTATPPAAGTVKQIPLSSLAPSLAAFSGSIVTLIPSGDTSGTGDATAIINAVTALASYKSGVVRLQSGAGQWYVKCGSVVIGRSGIYIDATGCVINAVGTGDTFNMHDPNLYTTTTVYGGGIVGYPWITGASTTGNSTGVNFGDIFRGRVEVMTANFNAGTTSKGLWLNNTYTWTEQLSGAAYAQGCTTGVQFDYQPATGYSGSATGSFARTRFDCYIDNQGLGDGVVVTNGVFIYDARLGVYGNWGYGTGTTKWSCLKLTGGASATHTSIFDSVLNMGCELGGTSNAYPPYTLYFGDNLYNWIYHCTGILDFSASSAFGACNYPTQLAGYSGTIDGDTSLASYYLGGSNTSSAATASAPTFTSGTAKQLSTVQDVMLYVTCKTSISVTLAIGPTSTPSTNIIPSSPNMAAGTCTPVRVPAGWYVNLTCGTMADLQLAQVTC